MPPRATLLLAHSPSQKLNQARLEAYLSAIANPSFDITSHLQSPPRLRRATSSPGTNTPRDLHTNLKLLELYTLHVLPRNGEWDYAREFIMMSEVLDDERKEAFLQALHGLKEEQQVAALREKEIQLAQQQQLELQRRQEETRLVEAKRVEEESKKREELRRHQKQPEATAREINRLKPPHGRANGNSSISARPKQAPEKEISRRTAPASLYARAGAIFTAVQTLILGTTRSLRSNPMLLLRTSLFILVFALAFGRRDLRERVKRILSQTWAKIRGTIGMGVKVSYI
jgi:DNA polymerase III alpha subunit (gram-positive type)